MAAAGGGGGGAAAGNAEEHPDRSADVRPHPRAGGDGGRPERRAGGYGNPPAAGETAGRHQRDQPENQPHPNPWRTGGAACPGQRHQCHAGAHRSRVSSPSAVCLRRLPRAAHPHRRHPGLRQYAGSVGQGRPGGAAGGHQRHPRGGGFHGHPGGAAALPGSWGQQHPGGAVQSVRPVRGGG